MKPREPYRSPFWRPDPSTPAQARSPASPAPAAASSPQRESRPARAAPAPGPDGYNEGDLAQFQRLMDFDARPDAGAARRDLPKSAAATEPDRGLRRHRTVPATPDAAVKYTAGDTTMFQAIEASLSTIRTGPGTVPGAARPDAPRRSHGYSPQDLEAFARLANFDSHD